MRDLSRFAKIVLPCLLLTAWLAMPAKAGTVETLDFSGTATCSGSYCTGYGSGPVTGTYSLDTSTDTIVGSWSFSTPWGVMSSSEAGSSSGVYIRFGDANPEFFESSGPANFIQFFFPGSDLQEIGALATNVNSDACLFGGGGCYPDYVITGSTTLAGTPEPSSGVLTLIGIGLLGLALVRRSA
ncbi:MAG: PEP-CTERM sorting domain-containing protein [Candidatus Acidiferrales bacterium]